MKRITTVLLFASLLVFAGDVSAFPPLFYARVDYGAGRGPTSVFAVDLDGDGDNDLAVANCYSGNVSVLLNNGDGTFQAAVNYGAGNYPYSVFAVDLDGDGDNDLAVANYWSDNVSVLLNNGDGTFQAAVNYGAGDYPRSVFAVDLDGDGDNDLAVANSSSGNVSVLLNNGDGTFQAAVNYGAGNCPTSVFAVDLDGDGDNDLTVANGYYSDNVSVLLNNGDGTFQAAVNYGAGDSPMSVFAVDLDGDGDNDLAVANGWTDNVSVLLNNGDGTLQAAVNYGAGYYPTSVFAVDLDGDGDNDLAVANSGLYGSGKVSVFLNNGDGTFQAAVNYGAGDEPWSVFAVDLDGDGDNDLAVANRGSNTVSVFIKLSGTTAVSIEIVPDDPPVTVPQGGSFGFTGNLTNNTEDPQVSDGWTMATGPQKEVYGPFKMRNDVALEPFETRTADFNQHVPNLAPLGFYTYIAYCGEYPSTAIDSSLFQVEVITGISSGGKDMGWVLMGSFSEGEIDLPSEFVLMSNYPNPFNAQTVIQYQLPVTSSVKLEVYNLLGSKVATLVNGEQEAGYKSVTWDASEVSSGIYFYKLSAGDYTETKRMMLVK